MKFTWNEIKPTIEWLYHLIRPRAHNRIALTVVVAGVAILVSPAWEPYLRAAVEHFLSLKIDPPVSPLYGLLLILMALVYHYGAMKIEYEDKKDGARTDVSRAQEIQEHDRKLAARFRELFPEQTKQRLESNLLNAHEYRSIESNMIGDAINFLDSAEAHFLNDEVEACAVAFADAGAELVKFLGLKFFVHPRGQTEQPYFYAMQPSLNIDRDGSGAPEEMEKYDKLTVELEERVGQMADSYDELIRAFHVKLLT